MSKRWSQLVTLGDGGSGRGPKDAICEAEAESTPGWDRDGSV